MVQTQGTNARKVYCGRLRILCVHIETSSFWTEFANKNKPNKPKAFNELICPTSTQHLPAKLDN